MPPQPPWSDIGRVQSDVQDIKNSLGGKVEGQIEGIKETNERE